MASEISLVPLESNPEVMNKFLQKLGASGDYSLVDVMGLDEDMLSWVPRPVLAVLLLFPLSDAYNEYKQKEEEKIKAEGQNVSKNVFYLRQSVGNACGTIALVHSVANNIDRLKLGQGGLKNFLEKAKNLDPEARGALLESSEEIISAHVELAREGQTSQPGANDPVNHHFIAFVHKDGDLYELDGRKPFPVNHGPTSEDALLEDAARVCREFMKRDPAEVAFTVVALAASDA